jgi:hypothetical protein
MTLLLLLLLGGNIEEDLEVVDAGTEATALVEAASLEARLLLLGVAIINQNILFHFV